MSTIGMMMEQLRRAALRDDGGGATDGQLLERFLVRREEAAFEALVRRHGAMVFGACRRVLGNGHDAEDAFQATFLVLFRKARTLMHRATVGNWLYGVAYHTALKARAAAGKRRAKERRAAQQPRPTAAPTGLPPDVGPLLDRELCRLPEKYRAPLVLCELEGKTLREAARLLGWPEGTVAGRLSRARGVLAGRLARCGLAVSAAALSAALGPGTATAAVPLPLLNATVGAAALLAAGHAAPSAPVLALSQGVLQAMFWTRLKIAAAGLVVAGTLAAGTAALAHRPAAPPVPEPRETPRAEQPPPAAERPKQAPDLRLMWSRGKGEGKGPVKLTHFPLRLEDIRAISPMGVLVGGHVTPSDHLGIQPRAAKTKGETRAVVAPAAGFIVDVQRSGKGNPDPTVRDKESTYYRVVIEHSGTFWMWIGLIDELDKSILNKMGGAPASGPAVGVRVPVKAGQLLGTIRPSHGIDFFVANAEVTLKGFVNPAQFINRDPWKLHVVDPFDYVDEPLKGKLLALNPRQAAPRGGKIDLDVDGRLIGNWYKAGTGGYAGTKRRLDYWVGHLAVVPHYIATDRVIVSLGDYEGKPHQFGVKGNAPDPAKVSAATGLVKYELIDPVRPSSAKPFEGSDGRVKGVVLLQVLAGRQLKVEAFPGQTADRVKGFTKAAAIYER